MSCRAPQFDRCSICLCVSEDPCLLDECLHNFCRGCIRQWIVIGGWRCPLCKQLFRAVLHDVRSDEEYKTAYVAELLTEADLAAMRRSRRHRGLALGDVPRAPEGRFDMSLAHYRRRRVYTMKTPTEAFTTTAAHPPRPEQIAAKYAEYSTRLSEWLQRELQALVEREDVVVLAEFVLALLTKYALDSTSIVDELRPLFGSRAALLATEVSLYLRSRYDTMAAYDFALSNRERLRHREQQKERRRNGGVTSPLPVNASGFNSSRDRFVMSDDAAVGAGSSFDTPFVVEDGDEDHDEVGGEDEDDGMNASECSSSSSRSNRNSRSCVRRGPAAGAHGSELKHSNNDDSNSDIEFGPSAGNHESSSRPILGAGGSRSSQSSSALGGDSSSSSRRSARPQAEENRTYSDSDHGCRETLIDLTDVSTPGKSIMSSSIRREAARASFDDKAQSPSIVDLSISSTADRDSDCMSGTSSSPITLD